jgi:carboxylesterase type B
VGDLRWRKPAPPAKNSTVQDGSYGNQCPNSQINGMNLFGDDSDYELATDTNDFMSNVADAFENVDGSEDCLFLDVYVPGEAVRSPNTAKLPVMYWFFGGGFVLGGKNYVEPLMPFYDGKGLIEQSQNRVIFVASNYRLGAFS